MSKIFKLVKPRGEEVETVQSTSGRTARIETDWSLCFICQEMTQESLTRPSRNTRQDKGNSYSILAGHLKRFNDLGFLPKTFLFSRLDEGSGVEAALLANNARYHKTCTLRYNKTKLDRAEKRHQKIGEDDEVQEAGDRKRKRSLSRPSSTESKQREVKCFFCGEAAGSALLHEAATFQLDSRVRSCAMILGDMDLQTKLNAGDMVAQDAKYHRNCLVNLYNRVRKIKEMSSKSSNDEQALVEGLAFAQLVVFIEEALAEGETAPVFKLADLAQLYASRMEQMLGVKYDRRVHTTRLKQRLLSHFPNMCAQHHGRDVLLAFNDYLGDALAKACELDTDTDAVHLARAAQIVRRHIIGDDKVFNGFPLECQQDSVPSMLLALVTMILEGPSIKDLRVSTNQAALSISQLLKFNSLKHRRADTSNMPRPVRHATAQETPLPIYIGLMLHAHTRKKELVDKLAHMGISISYDRVLSLSAQLGNSACRLYHQEQVVCPPKMRGMVFTTAAVDNIDHNPSSTTSKQSFHGTAISLVQHPAFHGAGVDRGINILGGSNESGLKSVDRLPQYYTEVPSVNSSIKNTQVPVNNVTFLSGNSGLKQHIETEYLWLQHTQLAVQKSSPLENTSWAAYHASLQSRTSSRAICPTALLPLFLESAHTVAMVKHSMDVVRNSVEHLNPGQIPVVTFDQPLFALAKQIQWKWPQGYGEEKFVILFGGLHIEMAALKTIGDLLQGSGWVQALVEAEITSAGTGILPAGITCHSNQESAPSDSSSPFHPAAERIQPLH